MALKSELANRGFESETFLYELSVVLDGLDLIDQMIAKSDHSPKNQNEIDIVCDGFSINMNKLREHVVELDKKLNTRIS